MKVKKGQMTHQVTSWTYDRVESELLRAVFYSDTVCVAAFNAIYSRMIAGGILFTSDSFDAVPSVEFATHINTHWASFAADILRDLLIVGYAAYRLGSDYVPILIPPHAVRLKWFYDDQTFETKASAYRHGLEAPDESIHIVTSHKVTPMGKHTSCMAAYLRSRSIGDVFLRNAMVSDTALANPRVYVRTAADGQVEDIDLSNTFHADVVANEILAKQNINTLTVEMNQRIVQRMNRSGADRLNRTDHRTGLAHFDAEFEVPDAKLLPLPLNSRVESAPQPHSRADIVQIEQLFSSRAAIAFGCSPTSLGLGTRSHESGVAYESSDKLTSETARRWGRLLSGVLEHLYALSYGHDIFMANCDADIPALDTTNDMSRAKCVFPGLLGMEIAAQLFARGLLRYENYAAYLASVTELSVTAFKEPRV
jgi:hypothetical protein